MAPGRPDPPGGIDRGVLDRADARCGEDRRFTALVIFHGGTYRVPVRFVPDANGIGFLIDPQSIRQLSDAGA